MKAINETVAFVLLLVFIVFLLAICAPYYLQAGKSSAELTSSSAKPLETTLQAGLTILDVQNYSGKICIVLKNTGDIELEHFKIYYVANNTLVTFNFSNIYVTETCSCEYGALSPELRPGDCGYLILNDNYSNIIGAKIYAESDYDARASYIVLQ